MANIFITKPNKIKVMKKLTLMILAIGSFSLQAQNDRNGNFEDWDNNQDGYVSDNEFEDTWEKDNYFGDWDQDGDDVLSEDEWNSGVDNYYNDSNGWDDNDNNSFAAWDQDNNGELDENEFTEGTYDTWDENNNNRIENNEYSNYYTYGDSRQMKRNRRK